jgi:hypothetical protein
VTRAQFRQALRDGDNRLPNGRLPFADFDGGLDLAERHGGKMIRDGQLSAVPWGTPGWWGHTLEVPCEDGKVVMVWRPGAKMTSQVQLPPEWQVF